MIGKLGFIRGSYNSNKQLLKVIKILPKYHNIVEFGNLELTKKSEVVRNPSHTILSNVGLGRSAITKNELPKIHSIAQDQGYTMMFVSIMYPILFTYIMPLQMVIMRI